MNFYFPKHHIINLPVFSSILQPSFALPMTTITITIPRIILLLSIRTTTCCITIPSFCL
jgi:hypothetical protein